MARGLLRVNLGGEGEEPGVINQQGPWVLQVSWRSSALGKTLNELIAGGHAFLLASNTSLPFPDESIDHVITNSVSIDRHTHPGPWVQTSDRRRILKAGGRWVRDGVIALIKP